MKIVLIHGQNHVGSSCTIGRMAAQHIAGDNQVQEFFLPKALLFLRRVGGNKNVSLRRHVGGKGRVLAYVHSAAKDCEVTGIEFNTPVADYAKKWADKKKNVNIINGNAFDINCDDYDIFYFNRPFMEETFVQFAEKMNRELKHPATVICYADSYMSKHLKDLPHWARTSRSCSIIKTASSAPLRSCSCRLR